LVVCHHLVVVDRGAVHDLLGEDAEVRVEQVPEGRHHVIEW
jgi:hypothetical protein